MTKRTLRIHGVGIDLPISKAVAINADISTVLNVERLPDGTYKLLYNAKLIDFAQVQSIEVIRED